MMRCLFTKPKPFRFSLKDKDRGALFGPSSEFPGEGADGPSLDQWPVQMFLPAGTVRGGGVSMRTGHLRRNCVHDGGTGSQKERE